MFRFEMWMRKFKFVSINIITVDIFLLNEKIILTTHLYFNIFNINTFDFFKKNYWEKFNWWKN